MKDLRGLTILVVDDDSDMREVIIFEVQESQGKALEASNGKEAFAIVQQQHVDVVVTDVKMPGGNGIELLDSISKMEGKAPIVIMMTGFADITPEEAKKNGAVAMLAKPFRATELLEVLFKHLP